MRPQSVTVESWGQPENVLSSMVCKQGHAHEVN